MSQVLGFSHQALINLLLTLDLTEPVIPTVVMAHFMTNLGCVVDDPQVYSLVEASVRSKLHKIIQLARSHAVANGSVVTNKGSDGEMVVSAVLGTESIEFALEQIAVSNQALAFSSQTATHHQTVPYFTIDDDNKL